MKKQWLWGTATSAFQIEGGWQDDGKGESIWDRWNHTENKIHDNSNADIACDHYHLWKSDIELLKQLGVNSYRFSISWPRILPNGGVSEINEKGIEFYSNIIDALLEANIEPFITLYHWDLPQVLQDKFGGWESNEIIDYFVDYAAVCFDRFRGRVKYWTSFNEPYCVVHYGYGLPDSPPGTNSAKSAYLAAHHIILSHAKAYSVFHEKYNSDNLGCFGIVLNSSWYEPKGGDNASEEDKQAQTRSLQFKIDWFAQPIMEGSYPDCMVNLIADLPSFSEDQKLLLKNATDFIGMNHYGIRFYENDPLGNGSHSYHDKNARIKITNDHPEYPRNGLGWLYVDWGIRKLLNYVGKRFPGVPLYITENGYASSNEAEPLNDVLRVAYLKGFLEQIPLIVEDGIDLRGYFVWSFLDNFEWNGGFTPRFGIFHVDYQSVARTRSWKLSAKFYKDWIAENHPLLLDASQN